MNVELPVQGVVTSMSSTDGILCLPGCKFHRNECDRMNSMFKTGPQIVSMFTFTHSGLDFHVLHGRFHVFHGLYSKTDHFQCCIKLLK